MKILPINYQQNHQYISNKKIQKDKCKGFDYSPAYYMPIFKASIPLSKMYNEYNWYINCDGVSAIKSFLKMNYPKEMMNDFLTEILKTKDRSYQLIDSIVQSPREANEYFEKLKQKLPENSENLQFFVPNSLYQQAYSNFIETKYNNAHTLVELLKIRPDWTEEALLKKHKMLTGNDDLTIGCVPKAIGSAHLSKIIDYIKNYMEYGLKTNKEIPPLVIDGKTYEMKFFTEGRSSKNVFGVFIPSLAKKYVIKIDTPENRSLDKPFSLGTLAKIDGYLTTHRSRNSASLCYYNHKDNFSIYKYIEHAHIDESPTSVSVIKKHIPDFSALGLSYNDTVGFKNFFTLGEHSSDYIQKTEGFREALNKHEWISVDNDHVTYNNRFNLLLKPYFSELPNAMQMFF